MTRSETLRVVNENLSIGAAVTHRGDEVKCWVPDGEGGLDERYLTEGDCIRLSQAFLALALTLKASPQPSSEESKK